jgi:glutathione synthase/RimK-type ligase-like ATP-grasp enzyme
LIVIISIKEDFHALTVQKRIQQTSSIPCQVVESDDLIDSKGFHWKVDNLSTGKAYLPSRTGSPIDLSQTKVVWWRRYALPQLNFDSVDPTQNTFVSNEWRKSIFGALHTEFRGTWVSHPEYTTSASNKLVQLQSALRTGWKIPETLVSQEPEAILEFCRTAPNQRVIAKAFGSALGRTTAAVSLSYSDLQNADLTICPAIYQHFVPGTRHLRINCFGEQIAAFEIETQIMDWRRDRSASTVPFDLDPETICLVQKLLQDLGLEMGIIDAKLQEDGDITFLEINPQGQYLFLEGATGVDLTGMCADFLISLAQ